MVRINEIKGRREEKERKRSRIKGLITGIYVEENHGNWNKEGGNEGRKRRITEMANGK